MEDFSLGNFLAGMGMNSGNGFGGGGFAVLIIVIVLFMFCGGGFGFNRQNYATQADIQRAVDNSTVLAGQSSIAADVQRGIYEITGNANHIAMDNLGEIRDVESVVTSGNANIINNLTALQALAQNCCCEVKSMLLENRYLSEKNTSDIMMNNTLNTQKVLDALSTNRMSDMQNQINRLELQNAVSGVVKYPMASTYSSGYNPFCGCGTQYA